MEIKKALDRYFKALMNVWEKKYGTYPKVPWDAEVDSLLYLSNPDEEGYEYWKPLEKNKIDNFIEIEKELSVNIHDAIKEYFNSYWFLDIQGFYGTKLVVLEPVEPNKSIVEFIQIMKRYEESEGREFRYIQIGFVSPEDRAIIFDNETGEVLIENFETEEKEFLSNSLVELISNLKMEQR